MGKYGNSGELFKRVENSIIIVDGGRCTFAFAHYRVCNQQAVCKLAGQIRGFRGMAPRREGSDQRSGRAGGDFPLLKNGGFDTALGLLNHREKNKR